MNGQGILVSEAALERLCLSGAARVHLWWDPERYMVGISQAADDEPGSFKLSRRGRSTRFRFIAATTFYERFGLDMEGKTQIAILRDLDGLAAFRIDSALAPVKDDGRRRRARQPKPDPVGVSAA